MTALVEVEDLVVDVRVRRGTLSAVRGVSLHVERGETLAIVGESGSGKTLTALAIAGLLPRGVVARGSVRLDGRELLGRSSRAWREVHGREIGMVFQDPLAALNPTMTIGGQIGEARLLGFPKESRREREERAVDALVSVQVPDAALRAEQYPHEFSGGMRQRAMIAMARTKHPRLLIADEPTTALDVTIQAQVLRLIDEARLAEGAACLFISHDLALVSQIADRVAVMYGGRIVEEGRTEELFRAPRHPYTMGLLASVPAIDAESGRLASIPGSPPMLGSITGGCPFAPRCTRRQDRDVCIEIEPSLEPVADHPDGSHRAACHFAEELAHAR